MPFLKQGRVMEGPKIVEDNIPMYVADAKRLAYSQLNQSDRLNHAFIAI